MTEQLMVVDPSGQNAMATKVAGACKEIVQKTAIEIEKRKYVRVEGWQAIANGFGCTASSRDVQEVVDADGTFRGFRAIGEVRRNSDGQVIATAEGFVGADEVRWFGGKKMIWDKEARQKVMKEFAPAPEYSTRAMCQTRAISRACRSAFAFVVVMIDEKMDTTPAEEIEPDEPPSGERVAKGRTVEEEQPKEKKETQPKDPPKPWRETVCSYGRADGPLRGKKLGDLDERNLAFLSEKFSQMEKIDPKDRAMVAALREWEKERSR